LEHLSNFQLVWFEQILYGKPRSKYFFRFSSVDISPLSHIFKPDFFLRLKWTNSFIKQNEENQWFEFWQILYGKPRSLSPLKMCFGFPLCTAHHLPNRKSSFSSIMDWKPIYEAKWVMSVVWIWANFVRKTLQPFATKISCLGFPLCTFCHLSHFCLIEKAVFRAKWTKSSLMKQNEFCKFFMENLAAFRR
jgi:hypothetical protein